MRYMKIAIDTAPISKTSDSAHKVRGVGMYINFLVENLPKYDRKNKYIFVENGKFPKDVDLIHCPYFDPFFRTVPLTSTKFVVTIHDLTPLVFPEHFPSGVKGGINWQIQKKLVRRASRIIVDSDCSGKDVGKLIGIGEDKIKTVYLAAGQQFKRLGVGGWQSEIKKKYDLPESFLLYVGDATWNKNLPRLVEAVRQTKHKLVLVGKIWASPQRGSAPEGKQEVSNNPWNDDLRNVLKKIEGDSQFIKLGFVPDEEIVKIYNLASLLIMPSVYEGFGLPVLEAMNCGTPVISSRGGSLPEIGGDAVWYTDDLDSESIRRAIEKVMGDLPLRSELSQKGLERAEEFNQIKSIEDLVQIYGEVA